MALLLKDGGMLSRYEGVSCTANIKVIIWLIYIVNTHLCISCHLPCVRFGEWYLGRKFKSLISIESLYSLLVSDRAVLLHHNEVNLTGLWMKIWRQVCVSSATGAKSRLRVWWWASRGKWGRCCVTLRRRRWWSTLTTKRPSSPRDSCSPRNSTEPHSKSSRSGHVSHLSHEHSVIV